MKIKHIKEYRLSSFDIKQLEELSNLAIQPYMDHFRGEHNEQYRKSFVLLTVGNSVFVQKEIDRIFILCVEVKKIIDLKLDSMKMSEANMEDVAKADGIITLRKQYTQTMIDNYKRQLENLKKIKKVLTVENNTFDEEDNIKFEKYDGQIN